MPSRKRICPKCGSSNALKIVYGYPSGELMEAAGRGEVILGGCCVDDSNPAFCCKDCEYRWGGNSGESISNMQSIKVWVGGHLGLAYSVEADVLQGVITYQCTDGIYVPIKIETKPLSTEAWNMLIKGLIGCDFEYWLDEYINNDILDGTQWSVEIGLDTGKTFHKSGSNHYPGRWKQFCRLISTFAGSKFE
jgi:hypothetical protein